MLRSLCRRLTAPLTRRSRRTRIRRAVWAQRICAFLVRAATTADTQGVSEPVVALADACRLGQFDNQGAWQLNDLYARYVEGQGGAGGEVKCESNGGGDGIADASIEAISSATRTPAPTSHPPPPPPSPTAHLPPFRALGDALWHLAYWIEDLHRECRRWPTRRTAALCDAHQAVRAVFGLDAGVDDEAARLIAWELRTLHRLNRHLQIQAQRMGMRQIKTRVEQYVWPPATGPFDTDTRMPWPNLFSCAAHIQLPFVYCASNLGSTPLYAGREDFARFGEVVGQMRRVAQRMRAEEEGGWTGAGRRSAPSQGGGDVDRVAVGNGTVHTVSAPAPPPYSASYRLIVDALYTRLTHDHPTYRRWCGAFYVVDRSRATRQHAGLARLLHLMFLECSGIAPLYLDLGAPVKGGRSYDDALGRAVRDEEDEAERCRAEYGELVRTTTRRGGDAARGGCATFVPRAPKPHHQFMLPLLLPQLWRLVEAYVLPIHDYVVLLNFSVHRLFNPRVCGDRGDGDARVE